MSLQTDRLILRPFEDRDREGFVTLSADPDVMRYFPKVHSIADGHTHFDRLLADAAPDEIHMQAAELKSSGDFIGFIGLNRFSGEVRNAIPGHPEIEIGWRLHARFWGKGLAPEGALAWLGYGFSVLQLPEIVAITYRGNMPSRRVMEKIGMTRDPGGDFEHPGVPAHHPIRPHVLYRMRKADFSPV